MDIELKRPGALGKALRIAVGCGLASVLGHCWLVQGLAVPLVVSSDSMAPYVRGPHKTWRCAACGFEFACGVESLPEDGAALCPNCKANNEVGEGVLVGGNRVWVDRSAFLWRSPRRFEVVVFRGAHEGGEQHGGELCIKRIVGLPGETLEIRDGDLFVNGRIARKRLDQLAEMAVSVHRMPSNPGDAALESSRWHAQDGARWRLDRGKFVYTPAEEGAQDSQTSCPADWLVYRHRQCFRGAEAADVAVIVDDYPDDQQESRRLNVVADFLLQCEIRAGAQSAFALRASSRHDTFEWRLDLIAREGRLLHNGNQVLSVDLDAGLFGERARLDWVLADHALQFAVNGHTLLYYPYEPAASIDGGGAQGLAMGGLRGQLDVWNLQVLRDIYYTPGPGKHGGHGQYRLGPEEYLLLGDNSPHAVDSRDWSPENPISGLQIMGKAVRW